MVSCAAYYVVEYLRRHCQVEQRWAHRLQVADYHRVTFGSQKRASDQLTPRDQFLKPPGFGLNLAMPRKHTQIAGYEIMGLHTDAAVSRKSNFMDHGTSSVRIREDDYRPFLLTHYALYCNVANSGTAFRAMQ